MVHFEKHEVFTDLPLSYYWCDPFGLQSPDGTVCFLGNNKTQSAQEFPAGFRGFFCKNKLVFVKLRS